MKMKLLSISLCFIFLLTYLPAGETQSYSNINKDKYLNYEEIKNISNLDLIKETTNFLPGDCTTTITFKIKTEDISLLKTNEGYDLFQIDKVKYSGQPGEPTTYIKTSTLKLEKDSHITGIELISGEYTEIENIIELAPVKKPVVWSPWSSNENLFVKNEEIYSKNQWFPQKTVSYISGQDEKNTIVYVQFYPVQYNPVQKQALVINNAEFKIHYTIDPFEMHITNYASDAINVIITTPEFQAQAEQLEYIHESLQDTPTDVITTDWLNNNYGPAEKPDTSGYATKIIRPIKSNYDYTLARKITAYLRDTSAHPNLKSITLFGDADKIPPSYYFCLFSSFRPTYLFHDDYWIASDLFYASPDYDLILNFEIGRIPVRNNDDATLFVHKIENWIENLDYDWFSNIHLTGGSPFGDTILIGELSCLNPINNGYISGLNIHKNFLTNDKLKLDLITKCFYEGDTGIVFHIDHGSGVHFAIDNKSISYNDIISLPGSTKYPAVLSVSCYNARYDSELFHGPIKNAIMRMTLGWDYSNCFAEGMLFSEGGGIAYWGGVRTNSGGVEPYFNDKGEIVIGEPTFMIRILTNILKGYSEGYLRMGEMSKYAHQEYIQTLNDPYYIDYCTIYGFVFLGDPVLKWPVQNEVTTYNCEYTIDPKPEIINEDERLPYYNFSNIKSISISIDSDSPNIIFTIYELTNASQHNNWKVSSKQVLQQTINPPFTYELHLSDKTNYLMISETMDKKESRLYFTTYSEL